MDERPAALDRAGGFRPILHSSSRDEPPVRRRLSRFRSARPRGQPADGRPSRLASARAQRNRQGGDDLSRTSGSQRKGRPGGNHQWRSFDPRREEGRTQRRSEVRQRALLRIVRTPDSARRRRGRQGPSGLQEWSPDRDASEVRQVEPERQTYRDQQQLKTEGDGATAAAFGPVSYQAVSRRKKQKGDTT